MEGYKYKTKYKNVTIYHNGLKFTQAQKEDMDNFISRCWDSLPDDKKIAINKKIEKEESN